MRFARTAFIAAIVAMLAATASGQQGRTIRGTVTDQSGAPVKEAVVQVKNATSRRVRSSVTQSDGSYRFVGLSYDVDYEVRAHYRRRWSDSKRISRFDSSQVVEINLVVDVEPAAAYNFRIADHR